MNLRILASSTIRYPDLGSFQSVMRPLLELDEIFFTIAPPDDREKSWQLFGIVIAQCQREIKAEKRNV